ncbi:filamentous hemagglutinin N-terminal domain-containing protein [Alkalinema pantanalense CENA528]|uniref:filamentous hemagglutinin N-terminal domain-containing protein n=1 Tax=Alkalinema pantanalense TaxID=1620705 RepID=UPI003D702160
MQFPKYLLRSLPLSAFGVLGLFAAPSLAQISAAGDGIGTIVNNSPTPNQLDITNGTRSGNNLFHSFQQFNVETGQIANFVVLPEVQNVLARVSGGAASIVDGRIQLTGGNSNLYLMNPAGIVFGNNATLNVPSAFVGTTANGIGFGNGQWFSASGANDFTQLSGTPTQFAFTESNPGVIINAGKLSTQDDKPLALIGGTIVATQYWENNGALALVTVEGAQVVELTLPGQLLKLTVKVTPMQVGDAIPNRWTTPIVTLPTLLTGGDVQSATQITTDANGRIILSVANPEPITVSSGDIVVDSIKIFNRNKLGDIYDVWIDAQKTFRAIGTVPSESINSNENITLPVSIRSIGKTTINHGGTSFTEAIGYQKDADGIVIRDLNGQRLLLDGQGGGLPGLPETQVNQFKYKDTGASFDTDPSNPNAQISTPADAAFSLTQINPLASYTKGLVVVQDSEGNGTLLGSLQDSSLKGTRDITIFTTLRLKGTVPLGNPAIPPKPRPPEISCAVGQNSIANARSNNNNITCTSDKVALPAQSGQILQIVPAP